MPYYPKFGTKTIGGRVSNPSAQGKLPAMAQPHPQLSPRGPAPAKDTAFATSGKVINTEAFTLGSSISQGQTYPIPTLGDVTSLTMTLSETSVTGSGSVTLDFANMIDHVIIRNRNGTPFDTIPVKDPFANGLNPSVGDLYTAFIMPTPTSYRTHQLAASTALTTNPLATITIPGIRCCAEDGPWEVETWYNAITGFGGTSGGVTAFAGTNRIRVGYGDAGGYNTKIAYQTIPTTGTGDYHLETTGIVKNTLLNHMFIENLSNGVAHLAYLDHAVVNSHGMNIDTNLSEGEIVQAQTDRFYNAFGTLTLCPTAGPPAVNGQFTIGDSDEFILNFGTSVTNMQLVYQYLLPSGDAY